MARGPLVEQQHLVAGRQIRHGGAALPGVDLDGLGVLEQRLHPVAVDLRLDPEHRALFDLHPADHGLAGLPVVVDDLNLVAAAQFREVRGPAAGRPGVRVDCAGVHAERPGGDVRRLRGLGVDEEQPAAHTPHQHAFVVVHQAPGVDADAVGHPRAFDVGHGCPLKVERLAFGVVAHFHGLPDLVGIVGVEQHPVGADLERLERGLGLLRGSDARDQVGLLADPRDEVLEGDDRPVVADHDGVVGVGGGLLGERLVLLREDSDVRPLGPVVRPPEGGEIRRPREVGRKVHGAVSLTVLAYDVRVGVSVPVRVPVTELRGVHRAVVGRVAAVAVTTDFVDEGGLGGRVERRNRHVAEITDAPDVGLVDEHPVDPRFEPRGDPPLPCLPVADRVVGLQPDASCHLVRCNSGSALERGDSAEGCRGSISRSDRHRRPPRRVRGPWAPRRGRGADSGTTPRRATRRV